MSTLDDPTDLRAPDANLWEWADEALPGAWAIYRNCAGRNAQRTNMRDAMKLAEAGQVYLFQRIVETGGLRVIEYLMQRASKPHPITWRGCYGGQGL